MARALKYFPSFHSFIVNKLGEPRHLFQFCLNWFYKPLIATSFTKFWQYWNPVYGYILLFFFIDRYIIKCLDGPQYLSHLWYLVLFFMIYL